jgi:hypothetical protein
MDFDARIAVLEAWRESEQRQRSEDRKEIKAIRADLSEVLAGAKMLKWIIGVAIASGPLVGVVVAKLAA